MRLTYIQSCFYTSYDIIFALYTHIPKGHLYSWFSNLLHKESDEARRQLAMDGGEAAPVEESDSEEEVVLFKRDQTLLCQK